MTTASSETSRSADWLTGQLSAARDRPRHGNASGLPILWAGDDPALVEMTPLRRRQLAIKRAMDVVLSLGALVCLAPLLLAVAMAIRLTSPGPALFVQQRPGLNGVPFPMLKFRTMYVDAGDVSGVRQTVTNDARVTPLGRFLRRTSIDELPQLINILRGDMSIIGPRPHPKDMLAAGVRYDALVPYYDYRLRMRPGMSGWAQVNGLRGPTIEASRAVARIEHDIAYVQRFSIVLDLKIILKTLQREFLTGSGT